MAGSRSDRKLSCVAGASQPPSDLRSISSEVSKTFVRSPGPLYYTLVASGAFERETHIHVTSETWAWIERKFNGQELAGLSTTRSTLLKALAMIISDF